MLIVHAESTGNRTRTSGNANQNRTLVQRYQDNRAAGQGRGMAAVNAILNRRANTNT